MDEEWGDPQVAQELVEAFLAELDFSRVRQLAFNLQDILARELPCIVLYNKPLIDGYRADRWKFPFTQVLDGLHGKLGMPSLVQPL